MKKRKESFFGLHFDFHAKPEYGKQGATLREEDIRSILRTFKPDFLQIDCKGHPGYTSYPSSLGNAMPDFEKDTLALWRKVTKEEDVALYMHYSGVYDMKYCAEHPEETVMTANGKYAVGATRTDGKYVDELMIPQLCELYEKYGIDGVWVDGDCWKATADFRPKSLAAFEQETGIDLEGRIPATPNDKYYDEYREYHRELFRRYLRHYVDVLHEKHKELQITSNWAFSDHMPEPVSANVDFLSGDLNPVNSVNSARYAARALAQQEHPWDLMSWNFRNAISGRSCYVPKHQKQIMQEAAAVISLGGAYQNYITQYMDGSPRLEDLENLRSLPKFMRDRQPFCFGGRPIHQAALLLSTYDRAREAKNLYARTGFERVMGATALLCDVGQSLEIICEHTLKKYRDEYKMIVVPELYCGLAPETISSLLEYAHRGGNLVLWGKNTCRLFADAGAPFNTCAMQEYIGIPIEQQENGHDSTAVAKYKPYFFTTDRKTFGSMFSPCALSANDSQITATAMTEMREDGMAVGIKASFGKGTISAIGFDVGLQYITGAQYAHRTLIKSVVDPLYDPLVRIESACGRLEVVVLRKDGKVMIQLVNVGGSHADSSSASDDLIPPVLDITLSLDSTLAGSKLVLQPEGRILPIKRCGERAVISIDRVDIHSVIEVCS